MTEPVVHLLVGPERHGVVRFGIELDDALRASGYVTARRRTIADVPLGRGVHVQFTDRLFGREAQAAVAAVHDLVTASHRGGGRVSATLHDLPQPSDGAGYPTRALAYATLCATLDGIVVSSEHERILLKDIGVRRAATVIPLPVGRPPAAGSAMPESPPSVAVFGFVYPGKGHAEVLAAMDGLPLDVGMTAVGEPSDGHDDLVEALQGSARTQRRPFVVTGHVPDEQLPALLRAVTVPVAHHRHVSASGSLNSWLAAGRRPLAPATRYVRELLDRNPGAVWCYDDDQRSLAAAIRAALDDPAATWLTPGTVCTPTPGQAAECYRRMWQVVHG